MASNKPIFVELPRRDATLVLPQLRELVLATLAAEGYGERPDMPIQYQPTVNEREGIEIKLLPPLPGVIVGEWAERSAGSHRLQFSVVEMSASILPGQGMPFTSPQTIVPPYTVFRIGFEPPPPPPLSEPAAAVIIPRERAISLDDW